MRKQTFKYSDIHATAAFFLERRFNKPFEYLFFIERHLTIAAKTKRNLLGIDLLLKNFVIEKFTTEKTSAFFSKIYNVLPEFSASQNQIKN